MKGELKTGGKLSRGVRRMVKRQVDEVITLLADPAARKRDDSIHAARKGLKRVRAAVRLVRPALEPEIYEQENETFRTAGQALSQQRDAEVLLKTLEKLRKNGHGGGAGNGFASLNRALVARHRRASAGLRGERRQCKATIESARQRVKDWPLHKVSWQDLCRGIRRTYKRGREAFAEAERTRALEHLHEWRKRVKDLWYQLCMIQTVRPHPLCKLASDMRKLGDHLGDDHDLAVLEETAKAEKLDPLELQALAERIDARRMKLQQSAFKLGRRLYAEKPADFAGRIRKYGKGCWRS